MSRSFDRQLRDERDKARHTRCPNCRRHARVNKLTRMSWHRDLNKQRKWCETSATTGWPPSKMFTWNAEGTYKLEPKPTVFL